MKTIEINTSFNVIIRFNLASVFERGAAFLIDFAFMWAVVGLSTLIVNVFITNPTQYLFLYFAIPVFVSYTILMETIYNGQTLGKMALKIQVVRIDGHRTRPSDYIMRWIFRLIDIYFSSGLVAVLTITSSQKNQRLGDILADTCVVKIKESPEASLSSILRLEELQNYTPIYGDVIKLSEQEMMLIKECIDRYNRYRNDGHLSAINKLVNTLEERLQIKCQGNRIEFLKTLIKDYVVLTR